MAPHQCSGAGQWPKKAARLFGDRDYHSISGPVSRVSRRMDSLSTWSHPTTGNRRWDPCATTLTPVASGGVQASSEEKWQIQRPRDASRPEVRGPPMQPMPVVRLLRMQEVVAPVGAGCPRALGKEHRSCWTSVSQAVRSVALTRRRSRASRPSPRASLSRVLLRMAGGVVPALVLSVLLGVTPGSGGSTTVIARPLSTSDLPSGFKIISAPLTPQICAGLNIPTTIGRHESIGFQSNVLTITEALAVSNTPGSMFDQMDKHYLACKSIKPLKYLKISGTGKKLSVHQIGDQSQGFKFELTIKGFNVNEDLIIFRKSLTCGVLEFLSVGPLDLQQV